MKENGHVFSKADVAIDLTKNGKLKEVSFNVTKITKHTIFNLLLFGF